MNEQQQLGDVGWIEQLARVVERHSDERICVCDRSQAAEALLQQWSEPLDQLVDGRRR
jgi:hypothetical protein